MKKSIGIAALVSVVCVGCSPNALTTEVVGVPDIMTINQEIRVRVLVRNVSRKSQMLPEREVVNRTTGLMFVPSADPLKIDIGDYPINRVNLNINPPTNDVLESGGFREYEFLWSPSENDLGSGVLFVTLPPILPPIPPHRMTISPKTEQGGGGNSGTLRASP